MMEPELPVPLNLEESRVLCHLLMLELMRIKEHLAPQTITGARMHRLHIKLSAINEALMVIPH